MFGSVIGMFVPDSVRALADHPFAIKNKLKKELLAVGKIRNSGQKNRSILKKVKDALNELAKVPGDQTEFKKHFSDVLEVMIKTDCGGRCLFIDDGNFKSKAASNPRIHHKSSSLDAKGKEIKHFSWKPTGRDTDLYILFTSEVAEVSITWSLLLLCVPVYLSNDGSLVAVSVREPIPTGVLRKVWQASH